MGGTAKRGRAAFLAVMLASGGVSASSPARANHTTCTTGANSGQPLRSTDCPSLSLDYQPLIASPYIDIPTSITYRYFQGDHASPMVDATYFVPTGWRFAVESVPAGQAPGGTPATQCSNMYDGLGGTSPARLVRGELLSEGTGMITRFGGLREQAFYGIGGMSSAGTPSPGNARRAALSFLRWTPPTPATPGIADLCMYEFTDNGTITQGTSAKEFFIPIQLIQIPAGDPLATKWSWKVHFDMSTFLRKKWVFDNTLSVLYNAFDIAAYSRRRTIRPDGREAWVDSVAFSRTPREPTAGVLRAEFVTCREGLNPPSVPSPPNPICRNDATFTDVRTVVVNISPPPDSEPYNFALLEGPGEDLNTGPGAGPNPVGGFSLVRGVTSASVFWGQPRIGPDKTVKGYVLAVAEPGDQDSRHFDYFIVQRYLVDSRNRIVRDAEGNPVLNPEFDPRVPCGDDGTLSCTFSLEFPMTGVGGKILDGNAKYDLALITVYADGARTDGLCDDGTPQGVMCDPSRPAFTVFAPGISTWQFVMRTKSWPGAFLETRTETTTAIDPETRSVAVISVRNPRFLLLVNFPARAAEFFIWGANAVYALQRRLGPPLEQRVPNAMLFGYAPGFAQQGKGQSFTGQSISIFGSDDVGLISFGNFKPDGASQSFRFDGFAARFAARGNFMVYDPHNWTLGQPPAIPPDPSNPFPRPPCLSVTGGPCTPTAIIEPFEGDPIR
jgi:hypothetical protein